jgi:hypothetical protein
MLRVVKASLALPVLLGGLFLGGEAALGAASPSGGTIQLWVTPTNNGNGGGKVLITGVVGDYGIGQNVNSSGQPSKKGSYKKLLLKKGTILVNVTQFGTAQNNVNPPINNSNCSTTFNVSAPIQIVSGTGAYAGITGTVNLTAQFGAVLPKTKSGSCNTSNNSNPLNQYTSITGSGTVSFS